MIFVIFVLVDSLIEQAFQLQRCQDGKQIRRQDSLRHAKTSEQSKRPPKTEKEQIRCYLVLDSSLTTFL